MSAPKALGVALVGAATVGVVVSLRYLVLRSHVETHLRKVL